MTDRPGKMLDGDGELALLEVLAGVLDLRSKQNDEKPRRASATDQQAQGRVRAATLALAGRAGGTAQGHTSGICTRLFRRVCGTGVKWSRISR
jgi:hypothetical protein